MKDTEDKLIQTYRNRGDEFRIPLRDGGWERLEAELDAVPVRRRFTLRWIATAAVAAALVGLLFLIDINKDLPEATQPVAVQQQLYLSQLPVVEPEQPKQPLIAAVAKPKDSVLIEYGDPKEEDPKIDVAPIEDMEEEEPTVKVDTPQSKPFVGPERGPGNKAEHLLPPGKTSTKHKWGFGLSAGSNTKDFSLGSLEANQGDDVLDPGLNYPESPSNTPEDPDLGSETENGDDDKKDEGTFPTVSGQAPQLRNETLNLPSLRYHHRLPISVGLSVQKKISGAFAVGTGLTYTYLHSDISRDGIPEYVGSQNIHYLGVPLRVDWLFYHRGALTVYLSGGALLEYAVSAGMKLSGQSYSLEMNRFQASANAAAGLQVTLKNPLSLFIEPGISYYFSNGSTIETIRSENPLMFNLQAGIRFTY